MQKNRYVEFMLADLIGIGCNFLSRFLFQEALSFELSVLLSYFVGTVTAYSVLGSAFTKRKKSLFKFVTLNIAGLLQTFIVSIWIFAVLENDVAEDIACTTAHCVALGCLIITDYISHSRMSPAKRRA